MNKTAYIFDSSVYLSASGAIVEDLALLIDAESDVLLSYGKPELVNARFNQIVTKPVFGSGTFCVVTFKADVFTPEQRCYVIRRAAEYSASGFCKELAVRAENGSLPGWLASEMVRVPIEL